MSSSHMAVYQPLFALLDFSTGYLGCVLHLTMMTGIAERIQVQKQDFFFCNLVVVIVFFNKVDID